MACASVSNNGKITYEIPDSCSISEPTLTPVYMDSYGEYTIADSNEGMYDGDSFEIREFSTDYGMPYFDSQPVSY